MKSTGHALRIDELVPAQRTRTRRTTTAGSYKLKKVVNTPRRIYREPINGSSPGTAAMEHLPTYRSILVFDVEGFSEPYRDDRARMTVRAGLYHVLRESFRAAGLGWPPGEHEDRGDGVIALVSPLVSKVLLIDPLLSCLCATLTEYNRTARLAERFRLRCAIHAGEVSEDEYGLSGTDLILAFRMIEAAQLRASLLHAPVDVAVIVSDGIYEAVIRHGFRDIDPANYHPLFVQVKKSRCHAWIHLPGTTTPPIVTAPAPGRWGRRSMGRRWRTAVDHRGSTLG